MARRTKKAPFRPIVFDTDILIWYFRGDPRSHSLMTSIEQERRWITSLTLMELYQGCKKKEEILDVQAFVAENISRILHPRTSVSEKAIHLIQEFALPHGLKAIDALIAASCLMHRAILATGNEKHFRFISGLAIQIFRP